MRSPDYRIQFDPDLGVELPNLHLPLTAGEQARLTSACPFDEYEVAEVAGGWFIQFPGGHLITDPAEVRRFILNQPAAERFIMNDTDTSIHRTDYDPRRVTSGDYESADALIERFDPFRSPARLMIGSKAAGLKHAREIGRTWAALARANRLGVVSLDTDPEQAGRPQNYRPGVPMLQLIEQPSWDKDYRPGNVLVVYYVPVTSWVSKRTEIDRYGQPVEVATELASAGDPSGFVAVMDVVNLSPEGVDEWLAAMQSAVRTVAEINAPDLEVGDDDDPNSDAKAEALRNLLRS